MRVFHQDDVEIYYGDCIKVMKRLPAGTVNTCITSPPYWGLRDYGTDEQIGLEETPEQYVDKMVAVFEEVRRLLREDGTLWLNLGDSYNAYNGAAGPSSKLSKTQSEQRPKLKTGHGLQCKTLKPKDLVGIPWMVAFALRSAGWYLRQDLIWHKPNPMPSSVTDRCTTAHEYLFLLAKSRHYFYDADAIKEPATSSGGGACFGKVKQDGPGSREVSEEDNDRIRGDDRNKRSVWTVKPKGYPGAHFATYPPELITPCVLAGCEIGGTVLDPFSGSGTTGEVAVKNSCRYIGIEVNPEYIELSKKRFEQRTLF